MLARNTACRLTVAGEEHRPPRRCRAQLPGDGANSRGAPSGEHGEISLDAFQAGYPDRRGRSRSVSQPGRTQRGERLLVPEGVSRDGVVIDAQMPLRSVARVGASTSRTAAQKRATPVPAHGPSSALDEPAHAQQHGPCGLAPSRPARPARPTRPTRGRLLHGLGESHIGGGDPRVTGTDPVHERVRRLCPVDRQPTRPAARRSGGGHGNASGVLRWCGTARDRGCPRAACSPFSACLLARSATLSV